MTAIEIDGRPLRLTNLEKVLWPETGFTKAQLIEYWGRRVGAGRARGTNLLLELGLEPLAKTSGSLGLHVHASVAGPLDTKAFARWVAERVALDLPQEVVREVRRTRAGGACTSTGCRTTRRARRSLRTPSGACRCRRWRRP